MDPNQQHQQQYGSPAPQYHQQQQAYGTPPVQSAPPQQYYQQQQQYPQGQAPQVQHAPTGYVQQPVMQTVLPPTYAQVAKPKEWQNGLMDCSPCESCLLGTFLPCLLLGKTSERQRDQTLQTYDTFNTDCLMFTGIQCFTGCGWIYVMMKRSEIREKFGIDGDGTSDCCVSYWCACCALIQQDKEVEARMPPSAGGHQQQYQAPQGMHMPQQPAPTQGKN